MLGDDYLTIFFLRLIKYVKLIIFRKSLHLSQCAQAIFSDLLFDG